MEAMNAAGEVSPPDRSLPGPALAHSQSFATSMLPVNIPR
jgi:hypothetical protein